MIRRIMEIIILLCLGPFFLQGCYDVLAGAVIAGYGTEVIGGAVRESTIKQNPLHIGMTQQEVINRWGRPNATNRMVSGGEIYDIWTYYKGWRGISGDVDLHFVNGRLASWSESS